MHRGRKQSLASCAHRLRPLLSQPLWQSRVTLTQCTPDPTRPPRTHLGSGCPRRRRAHSAGAAGRTAARGAEPCGRAGTRAGQAPQPRAPGCGRGWGAPWAAEAPAGRPLPPPPPASSPPALPLPVPGTAPPPGQLAPGARGWRRESDAANVPSPLVPTVGRFSRALRLRDARERARGWRGGPGVGTRRGGAGRWSERGAQRSGAGRRAGECSSVRPRRIGSATRSHSCGSERAGRGSRQPPGLSGSDSP